jgi:hypothetical protein
MSHVVAETVMVVERVWETVTENAPGWLIFVARVGSVIVTWKAMGWLVKRRVMEMPGLMGWIVRKLH